MYLAQLHLSFYDLNIIQFVKSFFICRNHLHRGGLKLGNCVIRPKNEGVKGEAWAVALDALHLAHLLLHAHVVVHKAQAAQLHRHGECFLEVARNLPARSRILLDISQAINSKIERH